MYKILVYTSTDISITKLPAITITYQREICDSTVSTFVKHVELELYNA